MTDRFESEVAEADKVYATHQIEKPGEGRVFLKRPDEGAFWTELIHGGAGTLIIHGDGPDIVFRSWRWKETMENLIYWVGHSDVGYMSSKVVMGKVHRFELSEAKRELREYGEELDEEQVDLKAAIVEFLEEDWRHHDGDDPFHAQVHEALSEHDSTIYEIFPLGRLVDSNFLLAQAACRRAHALLHDQGPVDV